MPGSSAEESPTLPLERTAVAILALMIANREEAGGADPRPTDVLLSEAGLTLAEIATLMNRPYEAVKSSLRRHRAKAAGKGS